jgi:Pectate lyase superfamily protein
MNKAITDGLVLMPPAFSAGLNLWSRGDGTPGSGSYSGQSNAALVPNDQDFGGCLELQKSDTVQKVRSFAQTPMQPGMYLRVTVRVKAVSGNLPSVRIAAWAGNIGQTNVVAAPQTGVAVALSSYGTVVTVSAIIGAGSRTGVDMVWGAAPVYAHIGLDLTGSSGGVVRIDDIVVEDITSVFHRNLMNWVDVRDYGAIGNGIADDTAAFAAADLAAAGRSVLVSKGTYFLAGTITFENAVRFEGTISMAAASRLICRRNYDLDTYAAAFGSVLEGFRRALQSLFYFNDHVTLDLSGRRVLLTAPIDVSALSGLTSFAQRRVLTNGQLEAVPGTAWDTTTVTSVGTYSVAQPTRLTAVANVANIPVGARISGTGVGREVYVLSKDLGAATVELSKPLWAAAGTRTFTFDRYKYLLDFSGFSNLSKFEITNMELDCTGTSSAILLAKQGLIFRLADSVINKPKDRGITSIGAGCEGIFVDQCQFLSNEQSLPAQSRTTIALNVNANDAKIRNNRIVRFAHFAVIAGTGNIVLGNHFFQGDDETAGVRRAIIVFSATNLRTLMTGNYIDNGFIEWSNEHDADPSFVSELSYGGLTITGNIFTASNVAAWFRWLVITPRGAGHFVNGLSITNNAFRTLNGNIDRAEMVDTTYATLDYSRFRNLVFEANTFNGVNQITMSPVTVEHTQNTTADTWVVNAAAFLPFGARARNVQSLVAEGAITNASNVAQYVMPYVQVEQGAQNTLVNLRWPTAVKGLMQVTLRCDNPV